MHGTGSADRAVSPVIAVVLLVAITVVLAVGAGALLTGTSDDLHQPPSATLDVEEARFTESEDCPTGPEELALDVTLTGLQHADTIYVIADGGETVVIWNDPTGADVGTTKRVANEVVGNGGTDVDIGAAGDPTICPGDEETFRFYAEYDGETLLLRKHTVS